MPTMIHTPAHGTGYWYSTPEGPMWRRVWQVLTLENVQAYLEHKHPGKKVQITESTEYLQDAVPVIYARFTVSNADGVQLSDNRGDFWLEHNEQVRGKFLYGEW